jgi:hypothetical protein
MESNRRRFHELSLTGAQFQEEQKLYRQLVVMAHGDTAVVERLISLEARLAPSASRTQHVGTAIQKWLSDLNRWA